MKKTFKKILSVLMIAVMCLTMAPLQGFVGLKLPDIFATEAEAAYSSASINIGDKIVLGTYDGKPITWVCVDIDDNGPLMLSEKVICQKEYDAAGYNSKYHSDGWGYIREERGSNCWEDSNIRQWLNTSGKVDYSHCPPSYKNEGGFMSNFTIAELSVVKKVAHKVTMVKYDSTRNGYCDGGTTDVFSYGKSFNIDNCYHKLLEDSFMLLDASQINRLKNNNSPYLSCGSSYFTAAISGNNYACFELVGTYDGGTNWACKNNGIRPAFYLDYYGSDVMDEIQKRNEILANCDIRVVDADGNPVDGAIVTINAGEFGSTPLTAESKYGCVSFDSVNLNSERYKFAMVSAELDLGNGITLSSKDVSSDGVWNSKRLSNLLQEETPTLVVDEPILNISLNVGYAASTEKLRKYRYNALKSRLESYAQKLAEMTNGHCIVTNISLDAYSSDTALWNANYNGYYDMYFFEDSGSVSYNGQSLKTKTATTWTNAGFVVFEFGNGSIDVNTFCHESGHLIFKLLDEYCYGKKYYADTNGDGIVCIVDSCGCTDTNGDRIIDHLDIKGTGYWKNWGGTIDRPVINGKKAPNNFGVMEDQSKTIELSNSSSYAYANNIDFDPSHPEWYTFHYYNYQESTEETVANFLMNLAGHSATYTYSNGSTQKAKYSYSKVDIPDYSSDSISINSQIESIENIKESRSNIGTIVFKYENSNIIGRCEESNISNIYIENSGNIKEIALENSEFQFSVPEMSVRLFVTKDTNGEVSKEVYSVINDNGTIYIVSDADIINGEYVPVDKMITILNIDTESYTLSSSLISKDNFNYENTFWHCVDENGQFNKLDTTVSYGEYTEIEYSCNVTSAGTYVLMSTPAVEKAESTISDFSVCNDIEGDGIINISFDDSSAENEMYLIYYSTAPIENIESEDVNCITTYDTNDIVLYVDEVSTYYFDVKAKTSDGSYAWYKDIATFDYKQNDENNDGIPDVWFEDYYMLEDSDTVATEDPDEDGLTNLREYQLGTNPVDPDTDGDNVYDNVEVYVGLDPLNKYSDGTTDDYILVYGIPDLSIIETTPYIVDDEVVCTLKNKTTGKAMRTSINLYIDDILTDVWDVNVDSESEITFTFSVEYLSQVKDSLKIEVDESQITRDEDYSNNTFVYTPITELHFENESITVTKGNSITLVPNTVPEGVNSIYKWSITDSTNISLDKNGIVKANGIGSAVVTAETYDGLSASCTIYSVAFDGAEYSEFDSRLINSETEVEIIGYIGSDTDIVIPSVIGGLPVTSISSLGSKGVESVTIPASITSVTGSAFNNLSLLKSIEVEEENNDYCSDNGILYSKDKTKLIRCPISIENKNVVVIDGVNEICQYAFYSVGIESVLLAESLSILRSYSFTNSGINSVEIPENVTRVEKDTFSNCYNLKEIKYNAKNAETGITTFTLIFSKASVFNSCSAVETISVGSSVQIIPTGMFTYLTSVKTVNIVGDSNLNSVSSYAFNGSTNISDVYYGKYYKDWNSITISTSGNTPLSSATLHCKECDGHNWNISNYIVVPTCVSIGSATYVCEICGEEEVSEVPVDSSNHPETEIRDMQSATCSDNGYSGDTYCTKCNTKILSGESINANGHSLEFVEAKEPSCNAIGWEAYEYCTVCDYSTYLGIPASHNIVKVDAKAATCTEAGWEAYEYCTACDYTTYKEIPASHSIVTVDKKDSTCTEAGYEAYEYCTACDYTTYKEIPVIEHTKETVKGYAATCEKAGLTDGVKCSVCGETLTAQQSIAKLAHKDDNGDYKCDYGCGYAFEKPVEPEQPDTPDEPSDGDCDHLCHKGGFIGFIWKIVRFFWKLFKMNPVCSCGAAHY